MTARTRPTWQPESCLTLDNEIDPTTGTVKAKAVFDNKDGALFPNQFVNIRLILQDRPNAIVVPAAALQTGAQGSFVFVVKPGQPPANADSTGGVVVQLPEAADAVLMAAVVQAAVRRQAGRRVKGIRDHQPRRTMLKRGR